MSSKYLKAGALLAGALLWVAVLHLLFGSRGEPQSKPAADGSQALIKYLDKSHFYEKDQGAVALRMDVLRPDKQPLLGLAKQDVQVTEEGLPVEIQDFRGPGTQSINVMLVIDTSGSMAQEGKMQGAIQAALAAMQELKVGRDRLGIIAFNGRFDVVQSLQVLTPPVLQACQQRVRSLIPTGGTVIGAPTLEALGIFEREAPDGLKVLIVMTDGQDDRLAPQVELIAERSDQTGVPVYTIGFGNLGPPDAETVLRTLADKCHAQYYHAPTAQELAEIYRRQVQELTKEFTILYHSPYPQADGLPRRVRVTISAPAGKLTAEGTYQVGAIVDSGGVRVAPQSGTVASVLRATTSALVKFAIFSGLFVVLAGLLLAAAPFGLRQFWSANTATAATPAASAASSSAASSSGPMKAPRRPPPPPKLSSPSAAVPPVAAPTAGPAAGAASPPGASRPSAPAPTPPPMAGPPGQKKTIRPVPPPPPRPGKNA